LLSLESHFVPRLGWFVASAAQVSIHEEAVLSIAWACLLGVGCGLLVGVASRFSAISAWLLHLCVAKSGGFVSYGMDTFLTLGLFYLMLLPLSERYSLDWRLRNSHSHNRRILGHSPPDNQSHQCPLYFLSVTPRCSQRRSVRSQSYPHRTCANQLPAP